MDSPDRRIHVLHVIPTLGSGGAERLLLTYLSQPALGEGFRHTVALTGVRDPHSPSQDNFLVPALEEQNIEVIGIGLPGPRHVPMNVLAIGRYIKREKVDLVHTHLLWANIAGRLVGRWLRVPVVSSFHSPNYDPQAVASHKSPLWKQELIRLLDGWTARHCLAASIAVSRYVGDHVITRLRLDPNKVHVLHNPVDIPKIFSHFDAPRETLRTELNLPHDAVLILSVGRLTDSKGYLELVTALAPVVAAAPMVHLALIGSKADAPYVGRLERKIDDLGMARNVHLLGARRDIADCLAAANLFVFPTKFEGFGIALAEAMRAGLACVATKVGPIPELIKHEYSGLLVPLRDSEALSGALLRLIRDSKLRDRLGRSASIEIDTKFAAPGKAESLSRIYRHIIAGTGLPSNIDEYSSPRPAG